MARKIVIVRGVTQCVVIPVKEKLEIDARIDCVLTQNGKVIAKKEDCDASEDFGLVFVELSGEETMGFESARSGQLSIRYVNTRKEGVFDTQIFEVRENLFGEVNTKKASFILFGIEDDIGELSESKSLTFTVPSGKMKIACRKEITTIVCEEGYEYIEDFIKCEKDGYNVYTLPHTTTIPMKFTVNLKGGIRNA